MSLTTTRDCLLVVQKGDHSLGYYDVDSGAELGRVALDLFPHEFALSPERRLAYMCHFGTALAEDPGPGGNTVSVVDVPARERVGTLSCGDYRRPHGIDVDAAGRVLVLSEMTSRMLRFTGIDTGPEKVLPTGGEGSHFLTVTADGQRAFCSNMISGSVSVIDMAADEPLAVVDVGERPEGSVLSRDERRLYVVNRESREISVIDAGSCRVLRSIRTRPGPVRIAMDKRGHLLVALYHGRGMAVIDPEMPSEQAFVALPDKAISISYDPVAGCAFLSTLADEVCIVDVDTLSVQRRIHTRADPDPTALVRIAPPGR